VPTRAGNRILELYFVNPVFHKSNITLDIGAQIDE
jgi:hypothetical protein